MAARRALIKDNLQKPKLLETHFYARPEELKGEIDDLKGSWPRRRGTRRLR